MARRKKGVKIKHRKTIYRKRKTKAQKIFSAVFSVVIIAGIVFLGYSIGMPFLEFLKERQNPNQDSSSVWTPPQTTTVAATTTEKPSDSSNVDNNLENYYAYSLPYDSVLSEESLKNAVISAKNSGYNAIVVTLKADGGKLYYSSANTVVQSPDVIVGTMSASQISKIISENDIMPIAEINVLNDNIAPRINANTGYKFENQDTAWFDNSPANGGKPWLSPFSADSKSYISELSSEIAKAGFSKVIASNIEFPMFRNSDLNYIGAIVKDQNRHTALTGILNLIDTQVKNANAQTILSVNAIDLITGKCEVFVPSEIDSNIDLMIEISPSEIPNSITLENSTEMNFANVNIYDRIKAILAKASEYSPDKVLIPAIVKSSISDADFNEVKRALGDLGYKTYVVK